MQKVKIRLGKDEYALLGEVMHEPARYVHSTAAMPTLVRLERVTIRHGADPMPPAGPVEGAVRIEYDESVVSLTKATIELQADHVLISGLPLGLPRPEQILPPG